MKASPLFFLLLAPMLCSAQAATKEALEKFSAQMQQLKTVAIDFEYGYKDSTENVDSRQQGSLLIKDNLYRLDWGESTTYFNGQLRWTYLKSADEVTVSTPNLIEDGIFANPSMLFSLDEKDYRYKQHSSKSVGGEAAVTEIELFPKDEKAEYRRINLRLNKATLLPVSITYYAKNSVTISIAIRKIDASVKPTAADFTFPVDKHPGVMIVDMR